MEAMRKRLGGDPALFNPQYSEAEFSGFGHIKGVPVGTIFKDRNACHSRGVHLKTVAGISGSARNGAVSICVSGGYEDDKDEGDFLLYTGTGGQENSFAGRGKQVYDQTFEHRDNAALKRSQETGRPVRVIRGPRAGSKYAPIEGYRYDGLYVVTQAYMDKGKNGLDICRFELRRQPNQPPLPVKTKY